MKTLYLVAAFTVALFLAVYSARPPLKEEGGVTYYSSPSSCSERMENVGALSLKAKAQSVYLNEGGNPLDIIENYGARIVKMRQGENIAEYYCFSPRLGKCVKVDGKRVNLHVVVAEYGVTVGTPLIFGSY